MLTNKQISYLPYDDYAQSANTLFHFMTKPEYLESIHFPYGTSENFILLAAISL